MRSAPAEKPRSLLEAMLVLTDEPNSGFSDDDVYANIITLLLAGEDTTSHSLAWAMHILAGNPELQSRLHQSACKSLGDARVPTTFRRHGQARSLRRRCIRSVAHASRGARDSSLESNENTELAGIQIPKGTPIFLLTRPATLDDSNYGNAREFKPERWVGPREGTRDAHNTKAFLHFGAGPRFCPGRYLATLEMKMVLATLARNFSVQHAEDPDTVQEVFAFTMMPSRLRLRLSAVD